MKKLLLAGILLFLLQLTFGQTKSFIDKPYLETSAYADSLVVPDLIYLDILIKESDSRNKISVEELEARMIAQLKSLGINTEKQLRLTDLGSNYKKYFLKQKDIMKSKAYELKVFDSQTAGRAIVALEEIGIANVELGKTEYSKKEELLLTLRFEAIKKAKAQAESLLEPLGQNLVKAIFIADSYDEGWDSVDVNQIVVLGYSSTGKNTYTPQDIEFKPKKFVVAVNVKFEIE